MTLAVPSILSRLSHTQKSIHFADISKVNNMQTFRLFSCTNVYYVFNI